MTSCYRWIPFESCDLVEIESWLGRCARRGLRLCSCTGNFARFERGAPFAARYRLDPIQQRPIPPQPEEDMLALYAAEGWEFAAEFGDFYIFYTTDSQAKELHTDPALLAYALRRQVRNASLNALLTILVTAALTFWLVYRLIRNGKPLLELMESGTLSSLYVAAMLLFLVASALTQAARSIRLWRALHRGEAPQHGCSYRRAVFRHAATLLLTICAACTSLVNAGLKPHPAQYSFSEYPGILPFLQLAEIENSDTFRYSSYLYDGIDWDNYLEQSHDLLAPCILTARQYGVSNSVMGSQDRYLYVQFYNCRTEGLAKRALLELRIEATGGSTTSVQPLSIAGMDEACFYATHQEEHWFDDATGDVYRQETDDFQYLFLRSGTSAIKICYAGAQSLAELAPRFAAQLLAATS